MNEEAYKERMKNNLAIKAYELTGGQKLLEVDTRRVTYKGRKWSELDSWSKRKLENLIVLGDPDTGVLKRVTFV